MLHTKKLSVILCTLLMAQQTITSTIIPQTELSTRDYLVGASISAIGAAALIASNWTKIKIVYGWANDYIQKKLAAVQTTIKRHPTLIEGSKMALSTTFIGSALIAFVLMLPHTPKDETGNVEQTSSTSSSSTPPTPSSGDLRQPKQLTPPTEPTEQPQNPSTNSVASESPIVDDKSDSSTTQVLTPTPAPSEEKTTAQVAKEVFNDIRKEWVKRRKEDAQWIKDKFKK